MATIQEELHLPLAPAAVWAAVREFGDADRLFAGVVTACTLEGTEREVTFADGSTIREVLVTCDERARRLVYAAVGSPAASHHSAALEVAAGDDERSTRLTWTTDLLPDALAGPVGDRMRIGSTALERALLAMART